MQKIDLKSLSESLYFEKLPCGLEVYLYKTTKSKNFYITISTLFGSNVLKYKKGNKVYEVLPGSAHFLEHKVMNFNSQSKVYERINNLGSFGNAYTTYEATNYNIFGNNNIKENIKLLYDIVFDLKLSIKSVEEEKGIIKEEISMNNDDVDVHLFSILNRNLFNKSYIKDHILGDNSTIDKMNVKDLDRIYNDFYIPSNMFTVVCGDFDENEVINYIKDYFKDFKNKKFDIKKIVEKEEKNVKIPYTETSINVSIDKVAYGMKIDISSLKHISKEDMDNYLGILVDSLYGQTSILREKYIKEDLIITLDIESKIVDNYAFIYLFVTTKSPDLFISRIKEDSKDFNVDLKTFERKKKVIISNLIMSFETVEDAENYITTQKICYNTFHDDYYDLVKSLNYKNFKEVISVCNNNYNSIVKVVKK